MNNRTPIKLTYLLHEWKFLDEAAIDKGATDFQSYLKEQLNLLAKKAPLEVANNSEEKISRNFIIPPNICDRLTILAETRKVPLGTLVRWYISDPLLLENYFKLLVLP